MQATLKRCSSPPDPCKALCLWSTLNWKLYSKRYVIIQKLAHKQRKSFAAGHPGGLLVQETLQTICNQVHLGTYCSATLQQLLILLLRGWVLSLCLSFINTKSTVNSERNSQGIFPVSNKFCIVCFVLSIANISDLHTKQHTTQLI